MKGLSTGWAVLVGTAGLWLAAAAPAHAQLVISEFMAINQRALADDDGDYSDWIEIHNPSGVAVNLAGWSLTDSAATLRKWVFPVTNLAANGYLVVFASDKNRAIAGHPLHTNFKLAGEGEYLGLVKPDGVTVADAFAPAYPPQQTDVSYGSIVQLQTAATLVPEGAPCRVWIPLDGSLGTNWIASGFDDQAWMEGNTGVGYDRGTSYEDLIATDVEALMHNRATGCYIRVAFTVTNAAAFDALALDMQYDDGFVAYVNGRIVAAANAPEPAAWNAQATAERPNNEAVVYEEFPVPHAASLLVSGANVLAIHGLNRNTNPRADDFLILPQLRGLTGTEARDFLPAPSPGLANDAIPGPVTFSPASRTFLNSLTVNLSVATADATIRYTLNGTEPTTNSPLYTSALMLNQSTRLRARAFLGSVGGPLTHGAFCRLLPEAAAFQSTTPLVLVDNFGQGNIPTVDPKQDAAMMVFEPVNGIATLTNTPTLVTRVGLRTRGETTVRDASLKPNLAVESLDGAGNEARIAPLGLPAESDWVLAAAWEFDLAGLRIPLAFELSRQFGQYASRTRFCEVYLNVSPNPVAAVNYSGLYAFTERIKRGDQRVDIAKLSAADNAEPEVSGGYIFRRDKDDPTMISFSAGGVPLQHVYPKGIEITGAQKTWLTGYINAFAAALNGPDYRDADAGYAAFTDVPSWVDVHILNMFSKNVDWPVFSTYYHKDRGGKLRAGPAWDFDRSMESTDSRDDLYFTWDTANNKFNQPWWNRLFQDPDFWQRYVDRLAELLRGPLSGDGITATIDRFVAEIGGAGDRNAARWMAHVPPLRGSWMGEVIYLQTWLTNRSAWLESQIIPAPAISPADGWVPAGTTVSVTVPQATTVYYTLDGSDPRAPGGAPSPAAHAYDGPFPITEASWLRARAWNGQPFPGAAQRSPWSPMTQAVLVVDPVQLALTELMYDPRAPSPAEAALGFTRGDFEFIELQNVGPTAGSLLGTAIEDGVAFDFTTGAVTRLDPGEFVVVVRNLTAFTNRYANWAGMKIAGQFEGSLNNAGERVSITSPGTPGGISFRYNNARGWPEAADGAGHSLVPLVMDDQTAPLDYGGHWRASAFVDGSPGAADPEPLRQVVLNEVVAHTDYADPARPEYDSNDWLELSNPGTSVVSLAGWYLSDDGGDLRKWAIPPTNTLAPGAWIVFDEVSGFHNPITNGFGLNKVGETVFLSHLPGGGLDRVVDAVRFKGQENGVGLGRWPDGGAYWYALELTPGAANAAPLAEVVIGEFLYHPATTGDEALVEFVEVFNAGSVTAALWNTDGTWRLDGGVSYRFPAGLTLAPQERLVVVGFDPVSNAAARTNFLLTYGLSEGQVRLYGPYGGQLDNRGERLALEKPLAPDLPTDPLGWIIVDEIIYFDRAPWPAAADGGGFSLARVRPDGSGNDPANWFAALPPTPGAGPERVALATPEAGAVVFAHNDEPLWAVVDPARVAGTASRVTFFAEGESVGTDDAAPFTGVARLPAAGHHGLRAELTDAAGVWTSRTVWVTALALSNALVTAVDDLTATVGGALEGATPASVWVHWGPADGGTNAAAWAFAAPVGLVSNGTFSASLGGLRPGLAHAVRFSAVSGGRRGWSPATTFFTTRSYAEWPYRATIRFDGYTDAETLVDFPALVRFDTNLAGFAYSQFGGTWASLRFTDAAGEAALPYEVDVWDTNGESAVWVRVPALTNGTAIRAHWGLAGATNPPPTAAPGAVWRADDEAVWHWQDGWRDATWRGHEAVNAGSVPSPGVVGLGRGFDGVSNAIALPLPASWYGANLQDLTVSLWVKPAVPPSENGVAWGSAELYLRMNTSPRALKWTARVGGDDRQGPLYEAGAWQLVSLVLSNGTACLQKNDGAPVPLGAYSPFTPTNAPVLGRRAEGGNPFAGTIDELRLSRAARSTAWLSAAYRTVAQPSGFMTYGPVESALDPDGDGMPDAWERLHFGDTAREGTGDWDGDGMPDWQEYVAGTDPTNAASVFTLFFSGTGVGFQVGFNAVPVANGADMVRLYSLEHATGLSAAAWYGVPGWTNLDGLAGDVFFTNPISTGTDFYRTRTWLMPAAPP